MLLQLLLHLLLHPGLEHAPLQRGRLLRRGLPVEQVRRKQARPAANQVLRPRVAPREEGGEAEGGGHARRRAVLAVGAEEALRVEAAHAAAALVGHGRHRGAVGVLGVRPPQVSDALQVEVVVEPAVPVRVGEVVSVLAELDRLVLAAVPEHGAPRRLRGLHLERVVVMSL